jgi:hypothetical protein
MPDGQRSIGLGATWETPFSRYADSDGDGGGTKNWNGDYTTPDQAILAAGATEQLAVARMIVSVGDTTGMTAQEYGNLGAALGNGIEVKHYAADGTTVLNDLTDGVPITTNSEWGALCYDVDVKSWGSGNELLVARWTFRNSGQPIHLQPGESIRVLLSDDLQGLLSQHFMFQGVNLSNPH